MSVLDRFLKYVSYDTQSDRRSDTAPSTRKQMVLAAELEKELRDLGIESVRLDPNGIVYAVIESNDASANRPEIGLVAHMDTAEELSGKNVRPRIVENYDGGTIVLNDQYSMNPEQFPELLGVIGDDLVVTDGTTLLGGDDKAGIAIIMESLERMLRDNRPHGKIWIAFTSDEEVGRGVDHFDLNQFKADFAYTVDGGEIRSVDYETFNAAMADIHFTGRAIHPGSAKNKMVNAAAAAVEFAALLPQWQRPEFTEGYEGFLHLLDLKGDVEEAHLQYLIRDHDRTLFEHKKQILSDAARLINDRYPDCCTVSVEDQYYNLKDFMNGDLTSVERAKKALREVGIEPVSRPIRGGTDGAVLTSRGLITPNLGTGDGNCHGRYEFVSINQMNQMVDAVCRILED